MKHLYLILFTIVFAGATQFANAQNISNEGSDFWTPFPTHDPSGGDLANMNIFVTCKLNSEVTVSCDTYSETKTIPANTIVTFSVPRNVSYINNTEGNTKLTNRGIHTVVTAGKPNVAVYAHIYAGARSAASLILPKESLGQKYYSMNYSQDNGGRNFLVLVAVEDNTNLIIHTSATATTTVNLPKAGDVYEYYPAPFVDLTGTFVEVAPDSKCKRFAAFSGSTSLTIACTGSRDPLFQQLYTVNSWGKNYGIVPFIARRYILRILAQEDNTTVNVNGTTVTINKGAFYETGQLSTAGIVTADKLISVAQYSLTQACSTVAGGMILGDPDMVLLNPTEFNIKNITVFSSSNKAIVNKYVNIFMKTAKTSSFKLNGAPPANGSWQTVPTDPTYSFIQIEVFNESLTLTADDGFNAIAYGFGSAESYAYSAGTTLASSQSLTFLNKTSNTQSAVACLGQANDFQLNLKYLLTKLVWKFGDGTPDFVDNAPNPKMVIANGDTTYIYNSPVNKTFNTAGQTQVKAIASLSASAGSCSTSDVEFDFNFSVDPLPSALFTLAPTGCVAKEISFKDESKANVAGKSITKWLWDFGDGSTSSDANPKHTYANQGIYKVLLMVGVENACMSEVEQSVTIYPIPDVKFSVPTTCINTNFTFLDASTINTTVFNDAKIVNWHWDFGDGVSEDRPDATSPKHQYTVAKTYTVTLTATSNQNCTSTFSQSLIVTGLPTADFTTPGFCLADGFANFGNLSKNENGTEIGLTYLWDFGDAGSGGANNATTKDGRHAYSATGDYTVTLTITNANGCTATKSYPFSVNGAVNVADFTIKNELNLCSYDKVTINSISSAFTGDITKVEVYPDVVNQPNVFITVPYPKFPISDDIILSYPTFGGNTNKTYTITLIAYSGENCKKTVSHNITIKPSPQLTFATITPICENNGDIVITQAKENSGLNGTGVYSGMSIKPDGTFDPKLAGPGLHHLTYTFTPQNGCSLSVEQDIEVYPAPTIDAGADFYILIGGEKTIDANATGTGLKYKWTPATGLSADDILNPIAKPEIDTRYMLTVTSDQGCSVQDDVFVHVLQSVNAPNSFTPNGDGVNDVWNVKYLDTYPNSSVEIFNRNGQRVFYSKGYPKPFDGNFNNQPLPVGTYYYIINPNSGRKSITGDLTIIR